jgi:hypothetical protein
VANALGANPHEGNVSPRFHAVAILLIGIAFVGSNASAAALSGDGLDYEEVAAISAISAELARGDPGWFMVSAQSSTFQCNPPADTGFNIGGCSGMRTAGQDPKDVLSAVRAAIPAVTPDMASDLFRKSQKSARLPSKLPTELSHVINAPDAKLPPGAPSFAVYPSRVGFNETRDKALVYLGVVHWTNKFKSLGHYLYLEKVNGSWTEKGRYRVWDFGGPQQMSSNDEQSNGTG